MMVGIGKGARNGILIKDAAALERLAKVNLLAIDKTGTLTDGKPAVTDFIASAALSEKETALSLQCVYGAELNSIHPLSEALCAWLKEKGTTPAMPDSFEYTPGKGIRCTAAGHTYEIGAAPKGNFTDDDEKLIVGVADRWLVDGSGAVVVSRDGKPVMAFRIKDAIRPDSREAVERLQKEGVTVVLLTGDRTLPARRIASEAGIKEVEAEMLPADKQRCRRRLDRYGRRIRHCDRDRTAHHHRRKYRQTSGCNLTVESYTENYTRKPFLGVYI